MGINKILKVIALSALLFTSYQSMASSVAEKLFDKYATNSPGIRSTNQGRVFYGGSFDARIDTNPTELVGFQPPSISGGCGGIDMFAGSFSIVSKDEVVQMLRGVAQGVPAYFFNLALSNVCSTCSALATELENRVSELNQWGKTSCETAALGLNKLFTPKSEEIKLKAATEGATTDSVNGLADGPMSWLTTQIPTPNGLLSKGLGVSEESLADIASDKNKLAVLIDDITDFDYPYVTGSTIAERKEALLRLLISMVGADLARIEDDKLKQDAIGKTLTVSNIFEGSKELTSMTFYRCAGDLTAALLNERCSIMLAESFESTTATFKDRIGFASDIEETMFGDTGIVENLRGKRDMTTKQKALQNMTNVSFVSMALAKSDVRRPEIYPIMETHALATIKISMLRDFSNKTRALMSALLSKAKARGEAYKLIVEEMQVSLNTEIGIYMAYIKNEQKGIEAVTAKLTAETK